MCSVPGCERGVLARGWCSRHYDLWRKYGDPEGGPGRGRWERTPEYLVRASEIRRGRRLKDNQPAEGVFVKGDYRILTGQQGHPLAQDNHQVAEHRAVLYDKIGQGPHACHWHCGKMLDWKMGKHDGIYADHLDGDTLNNNPENLVPSCWLCNFRRGLAGNPLDWRSDVLSG